MSEDAIIRSPPPSASVTASCRSYCRSRSRRSARNSVALLALLQPAATAFLQQQQQYQPPLTAAVVSHAAAESSTRINYRLDNEYTVSAAAQAAREQQTTYMPLVGGFAGLPSTSPPQYHDSDAHHENEIGSSTHMASPSLSSSSLSDEARSKMPTWLRTSQSHLAGTNLQTLHDAMTSTYLSAAEAQTVLSAIHDAARGDANKVAGAAEFCLILVDTMEMGVTSLVAAAFHYCTCVSVREHAATADVEVDSAAISSFWDLIHSSSSSSSSSNDSSDQHPTVGNASPNMYGSFATQITRDAALLKKTEAVAHGATGGSGRTGGRRSGRSKFHLHDTASEYANMQNLLLSETRDWRALAIRTAACLYRLRGLLNARGGESSTHPLSPEEVRESRDALHIYAPLASRLGMHRLKNELEGAAFRLKYRRQYEQVMALGSESRNLLDGPPLTVGEGMSRVLHSVAENVKAVLDADATFSEAAADVIVSARVKEPYSLWKKILKTRARRMLDVPDALALRVVINARKETPDEPDDVTAARERAMCYYVQKLCSTHWSPDYANDGGRFKDYIAQPKPNGYQSLHYTATTTWGGVDWPFEIQVRSGEMHRVAEYGLAAHFDYKEHAKRQSSSSAWTSSSPTSLNDETYLQAVQEWHWQQVRVDGTGIGTTYHSSEEVKGEPFTKIGAGYNPAYDEGRAQRVRARAERIAPYIESFTAAQSDLTRNHVFVFLASSEQCDQGNGAGSGGPTGTIISLPAGSCILDALREGARRFDSMDTRSFQGKAHSGVQLNGLAASSVTEKLSNGDVITLPTICNRDGSGTHQGFTYNTAGGYSMTP